MWWWQTVFSLAFWVVLLSVCTAVCLRTYIRLVFLCLLFFHLIYWCFPYCYDFEFLFQKFWTRFGRGAAPISALRWRSSTVRATTWRCWFRSAGRRIRWSDRTSSLWRPSSGNSTGTHGNTWKHTDTHGNKRTHTETYWNTRKHMETRGNIHGNRTEQNCITLRPSRNEGAIRSSVCSWCDGSSHRSLVVDPLNYFSIQPGRYSMKDRDVVQW